MKKSLIILSLFISYFSFGQEVPEMPKFNAKNAANLFYYNFTEIQKKIKIKNAILEGKSSKAFRIYNDKVKDLSFLNFSQLQELELTINTFGKELYTNRDLAEKVREKIKTTITPIRDTIEKNEKNLNDSLKSFLSKKQFKKWLKYQRKEKKKLIPKPPENTNNSPPPSGMNNRRRNSGMGGRRY
ncbi:MAG: hypothetical protein V3V28_09570 [Polaribacter sp.]|uniref:hypothetical protein n=1 Tax=Polaribacter sp. TaxID=1920175 RepID=UPI002F35E40F